MPVDPEISLAPLQPGWGQPLGGGGQNFLGAIGTYADIQNRLNQNRLFQQTFAARQRAGEIMAGSSDTESAIKNLMADPLVAPFAGETINYLRESNLALIQAQGAQQTQAREGYDAVIKSLPTVMADPSRWDSVVSANLVTLSPSARARVEPAIGSLRDALFDDLPKDPNLARTIFNQRLSGVLIGGGITPDQIKGILGTPYQLNRGGVTEFGVQAPPQLGGAAIPANTRSMTLAPTITDIPLSTGATAKVIVGGGGNDLGGGTPGASSPRPPVRSPAGSGSAAISPQDKAVDDELHGVPPPPGSLDSAVAQGNVNALGGRILGVGPSAAQQKAMEKTGEVGGDIAKDMADQAQHLPLAMQRVDQMAGSLHDFLAGGGAKAGAAVIKMAQALDRFGLNIDIPNIEKKLQENVGAQQVFEANIRPEMVSILKESAQGTGRVMKPEVDAFMKAMDSTTDPRAMLTLLNQMKSRYQIGFDQSQKFSDFKGKINSGDPSVQGLDLSDFNQWYDKNYAHLNFNPIQPGEIKGTGKKKGHYVPGKGIVWE